jgi:predicted nucleic acid-binding protein
MPAMMERLAGSRTIAYESAVPLLEVLVVPYRAGNLDLAARYEAYLSQSRGLRMVEIGRPQIRIAAQLRAHHPSIRTPDALQIAAALSAGCSCFVTNDRDLPAVPALRILKLRSYL